MLVRERSRFRAYQTSPARPPDCRERRACNDLAAARSEQFKTKVEGWIKEQEEKVGAIQKANRELNEKIADIEDKIKHAEEEGLPERDDRNRNKKQSSQTDANGDEIKNENESSEETESEVGQDVIETPDSESEAGTDDNTEQPIV